MSRLISERLTIFSFLFVLASSIFNIGCGSLSYLIQAGQGQWALSNQARPLAEVLKDEKISPRTRQLLSYSDEIKKFGELNGLKSTQNYTHFVQLNREAAVWVVSACAPLKFQSKEWRFPFFGSFTYLGWFNLEDAKIHAEKLKKEGLDVDIRGASAYSTLGWFRDPLLSTMLTRGDAGMGDLVEVILHESVHATLYLNDQSYFNESVASFIAEKLTPQFLQEKFGSESVELNSYLKNQKESSEKTKKYHEYYQKLEALYASGQADLEKQVEKLRILTELETFVKTNRKINNATLIQYRTYDSGKDSFQALLNSHGGDLVRFMDVLKKLKSDVFSKPQQENFSEVLKKL